MNTLVAILQKKDRGIGHENKLLYHFPKDMRRFQSLTMGHPVIMGRKTYESLHPSFKPLPGRTNIIITANPDFKAEEGVLIASSLPEAIAMGNELDANLFIIGGGQIYQQAFELHLVDTLELTVVESDLPADTFFPAYETFGTIVDSVTAVDQKIGTYTFLRIEK